MKHHWQFLFVAVIVFVFVLAGCAAQPATAPATVQPTEASAPTEAPAATEAPTTIEMTATAGMTAAVIIPQGALVSAMTNSAPVLDGVGDEAAWAAAPEIVIPVLGGANNGSTDVVLKSVHDGDMVYFLATWEDPTESFIRAPWEKQADGSWQTLKDPNDKGGDNNLYYEDKLAFLWDIGGSIKGFEAAGCMTACHVGENPDKKPYGNKYTANPGEIGDIWHWKSVRNLNQVDDQYLDDTRYSTDTPEAGRKSDAKDSGGYVNNETEDKKMPAFMAPDGGSKDGAPGYILDSEKVPFDDTLFEVGDKLPAIIKSEIVGDRGDIKAGWKWADGKWTLELGRKLVTGSPTDVQFDNIDVPYYFGIAAFDNAQVRHAFAASATPFVFGHQFRARSLSSIGHSGFAG